MIANRQLGMDDYVAMFRRRLWVMVLPVMIAPLAAFLISFVVKPKYTSSALLFVEGQMVPSDYVKPISAQTTADRMISLQQAVLSRDRLQSLVARLALVRKGQSEDAVVDSIRNNVSVSPADPTAPPPDPSTKPDSQKNRRPEKNPSGFIVSYTADQPRDAQQVCSEISSALLREDFDVSSQVTRNTSELLSRQLDSVKQNLDETDHKLATFKKRHIGQLPADAENNLRILTGLNTRLDSATQLMTRAEQDKAFAESLLGQEQGAWKSAQASPELPALQQELLALQDRLIGLEVRYTQSYPEIAKVKADIAELKTKMKEASAQANGGAAPLVNQPKQEPAEILQLRQQVQQNTDLVATASAEQKHLSEQIDIYQNKLAVSPDVEEEYKQLTRDYETAEKLYDDLLEKKGDAEMQTEMQIRQEAQQMRVLYPASLPGAPSFPVRWKFAAVGLGGGLALGLGLAVFLEMRDQSLRNEGDVLAGLDEQMLGGVPWVLSGQSGKASSFRDRLRPFRTGKRTAEA